MAKIRTQCPHCHTDYTLAEDHAGKNIRCRNPQCQQPFLIRGMDLQYPMQSTTGTAAPPRRSREHPKEIGGYKIERLLGEGAFGQVYLGRDAKLQRWVALKVPHAHILKSNKSQERFLREARAAAQLHHPHIVPIHAYGDDNGRHYLAFQFIQGQQPAKAGVSASTTLRELMKPTSTMFRDPQSGQADYHQITQVIQDLAEALHYAHENDIVHRDIKPANVLVDAAGQIHLTDFGLAHQQGLDEAPPTEQPSQAAAGQQRLTMHGTKLGTPYYMSPEAAAGHIDKINAASDQYSLGVMFYEMLTGRVPFHADHWAAVLHKHVNEVPTPPGEEQPDMPRDLEAICLKTLSKNPDERYANCQELADDLRRWQEGEWGHARRPGLWERFSRWVRRNRGLAIAIALSLMCLMAVAVVSLVSAASLAASNLREREARERADKEAQTSALKKREAEVEATKAREAELEQKKATDKAKGAEKEAKDKEAEANKQRERAEKFEKQAKQDAKRANDEADKTRRYLYVAHMQLVQRAWDNTEIRRVVELLDGQRPERTKDIDLRRFEWHYWWRRAHLDRLTLPGTRRDQSVTSVSYSPDGKRLACGYWGGRFKVWDMKTGKLLLAADVERGPNGAWVNSVAFSPDGKYVASGSYTGVNIWDAGTGKHMRAAKGPKTNVKCIAYSPDGKHLAAGYTQSDIIIYDTTTGAVHGQLKGHKHGIWGLAYSPNGKHLASASPDKTIKIWDAVTGALLRTLTGHEHTVCCVAFNQTSTQLASGSVDETVRVWDVSLGQLVRKYTGYRGGVWTVAFRPKGIGMAVGSGGLSQIGDINIYGGQRLTLKPHRTGVNSLQFSPDGNSLASGFRNGDTQIWRINEATQWHNTLNTHCLAISPDGKYLAGAVHRIDNNRNAVYQPSNIRLWELSTRKLVRSWKAHDDTINNLAFTPDGKHLVSASRKNVVKLWDPTSTFRLRWSKKSGMRFAISPDGKHIVATTSNSLNVHDATTGRGLRSFGGHNGNIYSVAYSPDGKYIASAGADKIIKIWHADTKKLYRQITAHADEILQVTFSPDSKLLASASSDQTVKLWDVANCHLKQTYKGHLGDVLSVSFSPDGKRVAAGSNDPNGNVAGKLILWDAHTGEEVLTFDFPNTSGAVENVHFSPDGSRLVCTVGDATVAIWEAGKMNQKS